jgi:hypothetical protein
MTRWSELEHGPNYEHFATLNKRLIQATYTLRSIDDACVESELKHPQHGRKYREH